MTCENLVLSNQLGDNDPLWYFEALFSMNTLLHRLPRQGTNEHDPVFSPILKGDICNEDLRAKAECILAWHPVLFPMSHRRNYQNRVIQVIQNLRYTPRKFKEGRRPRPRRAGSSARQ